MCYFEGVKVSYRRVPKSNPIRAYKAFNGTTGYLYSIHLSYMFQEGGVVNKAAGRIHGGSAGFYAFHSRMAAKKYGGETIVAVYLWGSVACYKSGRGSRGGRLCAAGYRARFLSVGRRPQ